MGQLIRELGACGGGTAVFDGQTFADLKHAHQSFKWRGAGRSQ